jgi:hypothetical protein
LKSEGEIMSNFNKIEEVEAVFAALHLSPIEKGMNEILAAKESFTAPVGYPVPGAHHRVILTNGTGTLNKDALKYAELERRFSRA